MTIINLWAVLAAAVGGYAVMWIWHMPGVFGRAMAEELQKCRAAADPSAQQDPNACPSGHKREDMGKVCLASFLILLVMTWTLAMVCSWVGVATAEEGMRVGAILGTGIAAAVMVNHGLWARSSIRLTFISACHYIPAFLVMGLVLGAWR
jgi:hypothetical protein